MADIDRVLRYWGSRLKTEGQRGSALHRQAIKAATLLCWLAWPSLPSSCKNDGRALIERLQHLDPASPIEPNETFSDWLDHMNQRDREATSYAERSALAAITSGIRVWRLADPERSLPETLLHAVDMHDLHGKEREQNILAATSRIGALFDETIDVDSEDHLAELPVWIWLEASFDETIDVDSEDHLAELPVWIWLGASML